MSTRATSENASSYLLPVATALAALAILIGDSVTPLDVPVAALYVVVVLMTARFLPPRAVMLVAAACTGLTLLGAYESPPPASGKMWVGVTNTLISLTGIGLTTLLSVRAEWADAVVRDQAKLLDLTHDSIFSRGMDHAITFWNRGSEELFGWNRDEAVGKVSRQLLQTSFPAPLDEIMTELLRTGRWEGELVYRRRDGSRVVSASRWSLQRDPLTADRDIGDEQRYHRTQECAGGSPAGPGES